MEETVRRLCEVLAGKYQVNEIDIVRQAVKESVEAIAGSVNTEVELAAKNREIVKLRMEVSNLNKLLNNERTQVKNHEGDLSRNKKTYEELKDVFQKVDKARREEQKKREAAEKKIVELDKRLEILLDSSEKIIPQDDKLRTALSNIMDENEKIKRNFKIKIKDVEKLTEENKTLQERNHRLNRTIQTLKSRQANKGEGGEDQPGQAVAAKKKDYTGFQLPQSDHVYLLKQKNLPENLAYHNTVVQRPDDINVLNSLRELGTDTFVRSLVDIKLNPSVIKVADITVVCNQYLNFCDLSENLNLLMSRLLDLADAKSTAELSRAVCIGFRNILEFDRIRLWILDHVKCWLI